MPSEICFRGRKYGDQCTLSDDLNLPYKIFFSAKTPFSRSTMPIIDLTLQTFEDSWVDFIVYAEKETHRRLGLNNYWHQNISFPFKRTKEIPLHVRQNRDDVLVISIPLNDDGVFNGSSFKGIYLLKRHGKKNISQSSVMTSLGIRSNWFLG